MVRGKEGWTSGAGKKENGGTGSRVRGRDGQKAWVRG